ncbi:DUF397 domain-containing protein [Kitasatospora sp. HPMI-4]|uniref:DUF397 domain-containing protein n=1 Tax=Kitasatospora sp. HPMI-4 TaxID=3448443 RepID=UPI003F19481B
MNKNDVDPSWLAGQLSSADWQTASSGGSTCFELAFLDEGILAVRDSKNRQDPPQIYYDAEYEALVAGILRGELRRPGRRTTLWTRVPALIASRLLMWVERRETGRQSM